MRIISFAVTALALAVVCRADTPTRLDDLLPPRLEPVYRALDAAFEPNVAMDTVVYMDQFWRIAGNPGFNASRDYILRGLQSAGVSARVTEFPNAGHGWSLDDVTLTGPPLGALSLRNGVAIDSFPTKGPVRLPLVDVGDGVADADYEGKDVQGKIVLAGASARRVWEHAVTKRGAAGIISYYVPAYNDPAALSWEGVPYDAGRRAFALKLPAATRDTLKAHAARGGVMTVDIRATFHDLPNSTLVGEIPGRSRPDERIVMVAHIQEPGANDDASGCGTLLALARALKKGIDEGKIPPPERTLTFLWGDEIRGSEQWLKEDPARAAKVQYMFSMDMTGEDTSKTGGTFLIEKQPDPSAVWERPSDPHTEWGKSTVEPDSLTGSLLNDLHLAVCQRRARDSGWVVRTNPYEGGSDHTVFGGAGIPSILTWHFTDRYYHTNLDRPDKVSAAEMKNVGVTVAASAWLLASATDEDARAVTRLIERAAAARKELEQKNGAEQMILDAWKKWYAEALKSVETLPR